MNYREQLEHLEILAEELTLKGDPPVGAGVRCERCGVEVSLPWEDRAALPDMMEAHGAVCPMPEAA